MSYIAAVNQPSTRMQRIPNGMYSIGLVVFTLLLSKVVTAQQADVQDATLVRLTFPITADAETRILATLDNLANRAARNERPTVVIEFAPISNDVPDDAPKQIGRGTQFERALTIARWLSGVSGNRGNRVRSIAYIPESISGHAVLVALACEEIAMNPLAEIGLAGIDEQNVDATMRQAYLDVASGRGSFPPAAVKSLLDPKESLVQIELEGGGSEFWTLPDLEAKGRPANAVKESQLVPNNQMAKFTGLELRRSWRWIAHLVPEREQLATLLKLNTELKERPTFTGPRVVVRTHLRGIVSSRQVNRIIRAIDDGLGNPNTNLVLIQIDSPGGNVDESLRLAHHIASIPRDRAEVVSFISHQALGDASLIALAADSVYVHPDAVLGGAGEASIGKAECDARKESILALANQSRRLSGDLVGCMCPSYPVYDFASADGRNTRSPADWIVDDPKLPLWTRGAEISYRGGLKADPAIAQRLVVDKSTSLASLAVTFAIDKLPEEKLTNSTEQAVEWIASQRWLSFLLFMVGIMCLSAELNTPGVGVPGAIAAVCFLLFFWINLFQGTVEWLEILLIVGGVISLGIELFLLPGFGVFGVCGICMLAVGLLLAGQTFVLPTNEYQWERIIHGCGQLGLGVIILLGLAIVFRKQLANTPMVRWFALQPPARDTSLEELEQTVQEHRLLLGRVGVTTTPCNPSGKAVLGDEIINVISREGWIEEDTRVEVIEVRDNHIIVRRAPK